MKHTLLFSILSLSLLSFTACNEGRTVTNSEISAEQLQNENTAPKADKKCAAGGKCGEGKCGGNTPKQ